MTDKALIRQHTDLIPQNELRILLRKFLKEGEDDAFVWDFLTTKNGLPHNWIYDLFQDSGGRVWIGTWGGGLVLYEGKISRIFNMMDGLHSNAVTSIKEDRKGRIWVGTDSGLNLFDETGFIDAGLIGKSILNIVFDTKDNLWAGCWRMAESGGGLFKFDGSKWQTFSTVDGLPGLEILKVFEDSYGNIWVGTYDRGNGAGVGCYDGRKWCAYTEEDGLIDDCVYSMFEDPDGNMWFGTIGGISIYRSKSRFQKKWHRLTESDGLIDNSVYCMFIDSNKKMWFGTECGVSRFDGNTWKSYTRKNGLVENLVRTILEDREGNIWFGTYPYERGRGGISIAKCARNTESIAERVVQYLPDNLKRNHIGPGKSGDGEKRQ